jgi:hypothetical protein
MNTNRLAQLYDQLTVWERIPLLISAYSRKDETEARQLSDTSPIRDWRFSEHLMAEQALHLMALIYIGEQLGAAATYFFLLWKLEDADKRDAEELLQGAQARAYCFTVNADAWKRFCAELGIASHELTAANYQGHFLRYCEEHMPANAPSAEDLLAQPRRANQDARRLLAADELLGLWRDLFQKMTGKSTPR